MESQIQNLIQSKIGLTLYECICIGMYCVLDILTFLIGFVPVRILRDFDVMHPDVNTELSTSYLFNISIHFRENADFQENAGP